MQKYWVSKENNKKIRWNKSNRKTLLYIKFIIEYKFIFIRYKKALERRK